MLRIALLDDHPAVLAGLQRLLDRTADLEAVCVTDNAPQLLRELENGRPDVVVLDYDLARGDGLTLCQTLKARVRPPPVVIYSAYAGPGLAISSRLAGADALVDKRAPANNLIETIRRVAAGESATPEVSRDAQQAAMARLAPDDVPVASMLLAGTSHQGIAETLATDRREVVHRVRRIVGQLRPTGCAPSTGDTYCRRCRTTFHRPLPQPYGALCPDCIADGDVVTLSSPPDTERAQRVGRTSGRRLVSGTRRRRRRSRVSGDA
jgi:two-component system, NarL family, response regulator DevR